jgi:hypothetical protein
LRKTDAEQLLADYDTDPVAALTLALRIVLDLPGADWVTVVAAAPIDAARRRLLFDFDETTLDGLARELNERRGFDPSQP